MQALALYKDNKIFYLCEKCACNSVFVMLKYNLKWDVIDSPHHNVRGGMMCDYLKAVGVGKESYAVHRNPFSRMVSTWYDTTHKCRDANVELLKLVGSDDFAPFVRWLTKEAVKTPPYGWRSIHQTQTSWLCGVPVDKWLRFEHLDEDFEGMCLRLNESGSGPWRDYYDEETAGLVREWADHDFEKFGYSKEIEACVM